ncbi:MAG: GNAT family N-acetyltransferase [Rhodobacteraceae bacterium]|nr:GNAT family N-acetyltransferase [Paracoccaceae bacterium]
MADNQFPIGFPVQYTPAAHPENSPLQGRFCRLEPFDIERHTEDLFNAYLTDSDGKNWTYLPYAAFDDLAKFKAWAQKTCTGADPFFYAVIDPENGHAIGLASYLRINPSAGSIEVGWINFSPLLQGTRASTEAMYLMMQEAFRLGYRRFEWKCDSLNAPSNRAAKRLGFTFEGIFRQALVYKGRNRDTAWFSVLDSEWPVLQRGFEQWLLPDNFDAAGRQIKKLHAP